MRSVLVVALLLVGFLLVAGCAGDDDAVRDHDAPLFDGPRQDGRAADAAGDASLPPGGDCRPGELYVVPCCGGALPQCAEVPDGGMCPVGTELGSCWDPGGGGPGYGCVQQCTPPAPYCAPAGTECTDECGGGGYLGADGSCACACA
jgi:hypothetical protein